MKHRLDFSCSAFFLGFFEQGTACSTCSFLTRVIVCKDHNQSINPNIAWVLSVPIWFAAHRLFAFKQWTRLLRRHVFRKNHVYYVFQIIKVIDAKLGIEMVQKSIKKMKNTPFLRINGYYIYCGISTICIHIYFFFLYLDLSSINININDTQVFRRTALIRFPNMIQDWMVVPCFSWPWWPWRRKR